MFKIVQNNMNNMKPTKSCMNKVKATHSEYLFDH